MRHASSLPAARSAEAGRAWQHMLLALVVTIAVATVAIALATALMITSMVLEIVAR